ncbi:MAG TPA: BLUF domain-containing protein [Rubrivivax sp.]|nr:BLUF domain-containing protein [Pseudomonadota bacterium]HOW48143.1 BLUF domain-containing protein [Rubrivivax sp.]HRY90017.1 BLUF domain-containing protein [Rubrivivax sp.]HRZ62917.1 BLUF domain-containing protein [Rubrivivax sp.]
MLVRLLYASRAAAPVTPEVLAAILRSARAHNPAQGITGVLCCSDQVFLQVLEGGRAAVNRLYARLAADPRHGGLELLVYESICERRFAGWAMGQVPLARLNPALLLKYSATARLDPFAVPGAVSMALLDELLATASIVGQH